MPAIGNNRLRQHLNTISRGTNDAKLGDIVYDLIAAVNDLKAQNAALLAKLDAANVGAMSNNNVALLGSKITAVKTPEQR